MQAQSQRTQPERHGRGTEPPKDAPPASPRAPDREAFRRFRMRQIEDALVASPLNGRSLSRSISDLLEGVGPASGDAIERRLIRLVLDRHPRHDAALDRLARDSGIECQNRRPKPTVHSPAANQVSNEEDPERWSGLE